MIATTPRLVVKLGGAAAEDPQATRALLCEVAACRARGVDVVLVHGGGKQVTELATRLGIETRFVGGRRVTDAGALACAKAALAGSVATDLAALGRATGVPLVAVSGVSGGLLVARRRGTAASSGDDAAATPVGAALLPMVPPAVDYGFVGDLLRVEPALLLALLGAGFVPLVASLAADSAGQVLNINADTVAAAIAAALPGAKLLMLTDVDGVLKDVDDPATRIPRLTLAELQNLAVTGGMLPKLQSIAACLAGGVPAVSVASWRRPGTLAACLAGDEGFGTVIVGV